VGTRYNRVNGNLAGIANDVGAQSLGVRRGLLRDSASSAAEPIQEVHRARGNRASLDVHGETKISYRLTATPRVDVPNWLLSRLLKHDAVDMIERPRAEIARHEHTSGS